MNQIQNICLIKNNINKSTLKKKNQFDIYHIYVVSCGICTQFMLPPRYIMQFF